MVQFANPENPRFEAIKAAHLHFAPVLMPAMKGLTFPDGSPAYTLCENVQTGAGTIDTACTPIQFVTGAANDNADLTRVFGAATEADFMPHQSGFARFWKVHEGGDEECREQCIRCRRQSSEVGLGPRCEGWQGSHRSGSGVIGGTLNQVAEVADASDRQRLGAPQRHEGKKMRFVRSCPFVVNLMLSRR